MWIDGREISELPDRELAKVRLSRIGFVFQSYNLLPVLTAEENAEFTMLLQGVPAGERRERVRRLFAEIGLEGLEDRKPPKLSGGQQQRVAVARAVLADPALVLADEPTANLDSAMAEALLDVMEQMNREKGTTFVFSTHDPRVMDWWSTVLAVFQCSSSSGRCGDTGPQTTPTPCAPPSRSSAPSSATTWPIRPTLSTSTATATASPTLGRWYPVDVSRLGRSSSTGTSGTPVGRRPLRSGWSEWDPTAERSTGGPAALIRAYGEFHLAPAKTRIAFLGQVRFASMNRLSDGQITCTFALPYGLDSPRLARVEEVVPGWFAHTLVVSASDELDDLPGIGSSLRRPIDT